MPAASPMVPTWSPLLLATIATCALGGAVLLRRAGGRLGAVELRWRRAALGCAVALLLVAFVSPLATMAAHFWLTAHLLQLTLVMGVIPALLLLALPPGMSTPRWLRRVTHPVPAVVIVNLSFFVWHAGPLFDAALRHESLYALQQASLLVASLAFWWPIIEPGTERRGLAPVPKLGYILLATIPQTFAGLVFALARHPFYAAYASAPRVLGLGVLTDQQIAGACLALLSKIALFAAFSVIFMRLLADDGDNETDDGDDGGRGRRGGSPAPGPSGIPVWLGQLRTGRTVEEPAPPPRTRELAGTPH